MRGFIFFLGVIAVFLAFAIGFAWVVWRLTGRIRHAWLRTLLRACVVAAVITPTIVPDSSLHGAVPMPASYALVVGVLEYGTWEGATCLRYGGIPLLFSAGIIWCVGLAWGSFRARRRRLADASTA